MNKKLKEKTLELLYIQDVWDVVVPWMAKNDDMIKTKFLVQNGNIDKNHR